MTREEEIKHAARAFVSGDELTSPSFFIYFEFGAEWADDNPPQDVVNLNDVWHVQAKSHRIKMNAYYLIQNILIVSFWISQII